MSAFKSILFVVTISIVLMSLLACSSTRKIQNKVPFTLGEAYYQHWNSGVKGGGSGVNLFISMKSNPQNIILDSVYFKGRGVKLELKNDTIFIGRFKKKTNQKPDIIMSNEPYAEYGNKLPELSEKPPFELKANECVVSFRIKNKIAYYKIDNVMEKELKQYH